MQVLPVIMAGGSGTRLWPLSRENYPKQFIKIFDGKSLLQHSLYRNKDFGKPVVIVGEEHRFIALEQASEIGIKVDIIIEPEGKNTAPCAIIGALIGLHRKADSVLLLPADHYIKDLDSYKKTIKEAISSSQKSEISTIGIKPSKPHTGYGYIELGNFIDGSAYKVKNFVEKPNHATATEYFESGKYCWNSGMFAFSPSSMISLCQNHIPDMFEHTYSSLEHASKDLDFLRLSSEEYKKITPDSIDYAIMEKAQNITCIKAIFEWNDLGNFASIWDISQKDEKQNVLLGDILTEESNHNYIYTSNKLVATCGIKNLIIINTEDSILVAHKDEAENIKKIVSKLKKLNREEAKNSTICYRPWGSYQTIDSGELHKVKRIIVKPHHKLSLQYHNHRAEHWVIVKGTAEVEIDGKVTILNENDSIYIPKNSTHRLTNSANTDLHLIEVQTGNYLGEDDIVRLTDAYGRK